jgi:hypothetical protein
MLRELRELEVRSESLEEQIRTLAQERAKLAAS